MITPQDIIIRRHSAGELDQRAVETIAGNTANTWQPGRDSTERESDTKIGKIAELAFERYITEQGVALITWDEIRQDKYQNHAPLDGFLMHPSVREKLDLAAFGQEATEAQDPVHFTQAFREKWEGQAVFGYELKSTRVIKRHLTESQVDYAKVLGDDFLQYPASQRYGELTPELRQRLLQPDEIAATRAKSPRLFVRVYVEQSDDAYLCHLIGVIGRDDFFSAEGLAVKGMPQRGKSEKAIYYARPLREGIPLATATDWIRRNPR